MCVCNRAWSRNWRPFVDVEHSALGRKCNLELDTGILTRVEPQVKWQRLCLLNRNNQEGRQFRVFVLRSSLGPSIDPIPHSIKGNLGPFGAFQHGYEVLESRSAEHRTTLLHFPATDGQESSKIIGSRVRHEPSRAELTARFRMSRAIRAVTFGFWDDDAGAVQVAFGKRDDRRDQRQEPSSRQFTHGRARALLKRIFVLCGATFWDCRAGCRGSGDGEVRAQTIVSFVSAVAPVYCMDNAEITLKFVKLGGVFSDHKLQCCLQATRLNNDAGTFCIYTPFSSGPTLLPWYGVFAVQRRL